jgi:hypothetical protein
MDPRTRELSPAGAPCLGGARAREPLEQPPALAGAQEAETRAEAIAPAPPAVASRAQRWAEEIGFVLVMLVFFAILIALIVALASYTVWRIRHFGQ